jgi:hypothetical protein
MRIPLYGQKFFGSFLQERTSFLKKRSKKRLRLAVDPMLRGSDRPPDPACAQDIGLPGVRSSPAGAGSHPD